MSEQAANPVAISSATSASRTTRSGRQASGGAAVRQRRRRQDRGAAALSHPYGRARRARVAVAGGNRAGNRRRVGGPYRDSDPAGGAGSCLLLVATALLFHLGWTDHVERTMFFKDIAVAGGLFILAAMPRQATRVESAILAFGGALVRSPERGSLMADRPRRGIAGAGRRGLASFRLDLAEAEKIHDARARRDATRADRRGGKIVQQGRL